MVGFFFGHFCFEKIGFDRNFVLISEKRLVEKTVSITTDEFERIRQIEEAEESTKSKLSKWKRRLMNLWTAEAFYRLNEVTDPFSSRTGQVASRFVSFIGCRRRSKDILLTFMYKEQIACWMQQADSEDQQQQLSSKFSRNDSRITAIPETDEDEDFDTGITVSS